MHNAALQAQQGEDIPESVKRYRQSIFKLDYKVRMSGRQAALLRCVCSTPWRTPSNKSCLAVDNGLQVKKIARERRTHRGEHEHVGGSCTQRVPPLALGARSARLPAIHLAPWHPQVRQRLN